MDGFTAQYEVNGVIYSLTETEQIHEQLQNDPNFALEYFRENAPATEIIGVADNSESGTEFMWTTNATKLLIHLYKERMLHFRNPKQKKKLLWGEIKQKFEEHGYKELTEDMLDRKFRNMKKTFRTIKDNNKKTSTGRGRIGWEYFDEFLDIFQDDKTVNFGHVISSMEPSLQSESYSCSLNITSNEGSTSPDPITAPPDMATKFQSNDHLQMTSSTSSTVKNKRGKKLIEFQKKQLAVEEQRIEELRKLRDAVERSNQIQEKRNDLLSKIVEKM